MCAAVRSQPPVMMRSQVWPQAHRANETLWRVYCAGETEKERERAATAQDSKSRVWMHRQQAQSAAHAIRLERDMSARDKARANRAEKQVPLLSIQASTRMPAQLPRLLVARPVCAASGIRVHGMNECRRPDDARDAA